MRRQSHPHSTNEWGAIETSYIDEFGAVAPDVYAAAGRIWLKSLDYTARVFQAGDLARTRTLLLKATALVTRARDEKAHNINELEGYLFQTFKHVVLAELERDKNRQKFEQRTQVDAEWQSQASNVERRILIDEIVEAMDEWTRQVFEWLVLDYTFEDISHSLGMDSKVLRNKYNRRLDRLMKHITGRPGVKDSRTRR